jgi:hypothetical protein
MQLNIARRDHRELHPAGIGFLTLTYPGIWSPDPKQWKRNLDNVRAAVARHWGKTEWVWKLEPQRRGAPHFHLLAYLPESITKDLKPFKNRKNCKRWRGSKLTEFRKWCDDTWYRIVGSGDERHRRAGVQVQIASAAAAARYAGKYIGKECQFVDPETGEILSPGRFWGRKNRGILPVKEHSTMTTWKAAMRIARQARRYTQHKQKERRINTRFHEHNHATFKYLIPWDVVRQILGSVNHKNDLINDPSLLRVSNDIYGNRQAVFMPLPNDLDDAARIPI